MPCFPRARYSFGVGLGSSPEPDELDQVFNSEVGEGFDAIFSDATDPDHAIFDLHFNGDVPQPICIRPVKAALPNEARC